MTDRLNTFDDLSVIGQIESPNTRSTLVMQGDGNLVLYRGGKARWATGTVGRAVAQAVMQGDGNFVLYGPGGTYVWDSGTDGHPGASLVVQDDGNVVIYDTAGVPLWASNTSITMRSVPGFLPSTSAFHFANSFDHAPDVKITFAGQTITIGDAANGLCGGMAFAVRDYFVAGVPIPATSTLSLSGSLFDYIVARLFDSFNLLLPAPPPPAPPFVMVSPLPPFGPGPLTYWWLMNPDLPDHETWASNANFAPHGRAWVTINDAWPKIRADLDSNRLSPIALIEVIDHDPTKMGDNHQVLAYGYELDGTDLSIRVYDPNYPDQDDVTLTLDIGDPQHTTTITHSRAGEVHCFFQQIFTPPLLPLPVIPAPAPPAPAAEEPEPSGTPFDPTGSVVLAQPGRDIALVRQTPGWGSIPIAFANGDGTWNITNGAAGPDFIPAWANQPGVRLVPGDFNGNGLTDIALVRQTPGWGSIPIAFANGDGTWNITNGAAGPDFIPAWANQPGVRLVPGDFNGNGLTDIALVRQTPGWGSIPIAFANGDGTWNITNGAAGPDFIPAWANQPGVRLVPGDFNGNGLTDIALVRQTPGWGSIPIAFANGDGTWNITNGAAGPDFIPAWANQPGVRLVPGDFNGNGLTDIALVRQTPGWGSIPIAFANGDGTWNITNGAAGPDFIPAWANQPGVRLVPGDFNGNGLTDIALVRQTPGWGSIPIAFANGDGTWNITNGAAGPDFIPAWANQPGVRLVPGDFNGNGLTDIALVRQTPGWGSIPIAFANGDGTWNITNGAAGPDFIPAWANQPGVRLVPGRLR